MSNTTPEGLGARTPDTATADRVNGQIRQGVGDEGGARANICAQGSEGGWQMGVSIDVRCAELPKELRTCIAAQLHAHWVARVQ
eukprot:1123830-Pelagomonas_calceolata.AAC.1